MDLSQIYSYAGEYRGKIINSVIGLERTMDVYLAEYFSPLDDEKQDELLLLILWTDRMTFDGKKQIIDYLCKENKINLLVEYPSILLDLNFIMRKRNILAHYILDSTPQASNLEFGVIRLIKHKNTTSFELFSMDEVYELHRKIETLNRFIKSKLQLSTPPSSSSTGASIEPS